ncbi:High cysteine membrane protein [Giardia muris]|uniref:High cysteine membrane protein n=1 Tax=Giardia muris TaxID=5742 RepID=A0A4Z1TBN2_GIAMU|nr:High cysteine membrane protein [Giardia muris]|eukprot:TNJ30657.1 High cysteine membrane protein [Giardia muris]
MLVLSTLATLTLGATCGTARVTCAHGTCEIHDNAYYCSCYPGWSGGDCNSCLPDFERLEKDGETRCVHRNCIMNGAECPSNSLIWRGSQDGQCATFGNIWQCGCPDGFVIYRNACVSTSCYESAVEGVVSDPPCGGNGRCLPADLYVPHPDTYRCYCDAAHAGEFCAECDSMSAQLISGKCVPSSCVFNSSSGPKECDGHGTCVSDVDPVSGKITHYCMCDSSYISVGTNGCYESGTVATIDFENSLCAGFGAYVQSFFPYCSCTSREISITGGCFPSDCYGAESGISRERTPCGFVGFCDAGLVTQCSCPSFATGKYCETCVSGKSVKINDRCVPVECLNKDNKLTGTCVKLGDTYVLRCPEFTVNIDGDCLSSMCIDPLLGTVCSGAGECKNNKCTCNSGFSLVETGRCVPSSLIDSKNRICSSNGTLVLTNNATPSEATSWTCSCGPLYGATNCQEFNDTTSKEINGRRISIECMNEDKECNDVGQCDAFGTTANPRYYCAARADDKINVAAYNATTMAPRGCVHASQADPHLRLLCGFVQGRTDYELVNVEDVCNTTSMPTGECTCPNGFETAYFDGSTHVTSTCFNSACRTSQGDSYTNFCGGVGDCLLDEQGQYRCVCGPNAAWSDTLKTCVAKLCQSPDGDSICGGHGQCVPHQSDWRCECDEGFYSSNGTCVSTKCITEYTSGTVVCGGPGAGTCIEENGDWTCSCAPGFHKYNGTCISELCVAAGAEVSDEGAICSGRGDCLYNPVLGSYGCTCREGLPFGPHCTHQNCSAQLYYNQRTTYQECGFYGAGKCDVTAGACTCNPGYTTLSTAPFCALPICVSDNKYCNDDKLSACDATTGCLCTPDKMAADKSCFPKACVSEYNGKYRECGGHGKCGVDYNNAPTCKCNSSIAQSVSMTVMGTTVTTCVPKMCVSTSGFINEMCNGVGQCTSSGCRCIDHYLSNGTNECISELCFAYDSSGSRRPCGGLGTLSTKAGLSGYEKYYCQCPYGPSNTYTQLDHLCIPNVCIAEVSGEKLVCGGPAAGDCYINQNGNQSRCICKEGYYLFAPNRCIRQECMTDVSGVQQECNGHGSCGAFIEDTKTYCQCNKGYETIIGGDGRVHICVDQNCLTQGMKEVCTGHGTCSGSACVCDQGYAGQFCSTCDTGYSLSPTGACVQNTCVNNCGEKGQCIYNEDSMEFKCRCTDIHFIVRDGWCQRPLCALVDPATGRQSICNHLGTCDPEERTCICEHGAAKLANNLCLFPECFTNTTGPLDPSNPNHICNGRGICAHRTGTTGTCQCHDGYQTDPVTQHCHPVGCFPSKSSSNGVCGGNGACTDYGSCICNEGYTLTDGHGCVPKACVGEKDICSGFGDCTLVDTAYVCTCPDGFSSSGPHCVPNTRGGFTTGQMVGISLGVAAVTVLIGGGALGIARCIINKKGKYTRLSSHNSNSPGRTMLISSYYDESTII